MRKKFLKQKKLKKYSYVVYEKIVICVLRPKSASFSFESEFSGRGAAEA
jgi:hypothetical protein